MSLQSEVESIARELEFGCLLMTGEEGRHFLLNVIDHRFRTGAITPLRGFREICSLGCAARASAALPAAFRSSKETRSNALIHGPLGRAARMLFNKDRCRKLSEEYASLGVRVVAVLFGRLG